MKQLKIKGFLRVDGKELIYDVFIRKCNSLERFYPAKIIIKGETDKLGGPLYTIM